MFEQTNSSYALKKRLRNTSKEASLSCWPNWPPIWYSGVTSRESQWLAPHILMSEVWGRRLSRQVRRNDEISKDIFGENYRRMEGET